MLVDVIDAHVIHGHRVFIRFEDGMEGEVDLKAHLNLEGVFSSLEDPSNFAKLSVDPDLGTICWPTGADVAPETLYAWVKRA